MLERSNRQFDIRACIFEINFNIGFHPFLYRLTDIRVIVGKYYALIRTSWALASAHHLR